MQSLKRSLLQFNLVNPLFLLLSSVGVEGGSTVLTFFFFKALSPVLLILFLLCIESLLSLCVSENESECVCRNLVEEPVIVTFLIDTGKPDTEDLIRGLNNSITEDFLPRRLEGLVPYLPSWYLWVLLGYRGRMGS